MTRVNQATLDMLSKGGTGGGSSVAGSRKVTDVIAYRGVGDMQHNSSLTVQVDHRSESVLVPIYGMLVPFHILTLRNASNNQVRAYLAAPAWRHPVSTGPLLCACSSCHLWMSASP